MTTDPARARPPAVPGGCLASGARRIRRRLAAITVVLVMVATVVSLTTGVHASALRRHPARRRPPRPLVRPLRAGGSDRVRLPRRAERLARRFLQPVAVEIPHGGSRRRIRLHVPRPRPASAVVHASGSPPAHSPSPHRRHPQVVPSIRAIILSAARRHHVAPSWLLQVAVCESGLDPLAYNQNSGASGLFQFMPSTFYGNGGHDLWNPFQQADVAAAMFATGQSSAWACA